MANRSVRTVVATLASALVILTSASAANATTYYLENVKFSDGTVATGSFSTNVYGYVDAIDIVTDTGTITGFNYVDDINANYNPGDATIVFNHDDPDYDGFLSLTGTGPLDGATPDPLVTGGASFECSSFSCPDGIARNVVSGILTTVSPVPEPATWAFMLVGCAAIGIALRRQQHSNRWLAA